MPINLLGSTSGYTQIVAAAVAGNNTLTLPTTTGNLLTDNGSGSLSLSGNLAFTGTGNRITGDFSNTTLANRVMFQSSTTNGLTAISAFPNGTATVSTLNLYNNSDLTNNSVGQLQANGVEVRVLSDKFGTGSYLPMTFYTGGSERMRIDTSGNVGVGTSSPSSYGKLGIVTADGAAGVVASGATGMLRMYGYTSGAGGAYIDSANAAQSAYLPIQINGLYSVFATGGTERMRIDASGNVGIGATSPYNKLTVENSAGTSPPALGAQGGHFSLSNGTYGMLSGVTSGGNGWIQVQRTDSTATAYNLFLQPSGGTVQVGGTTVGNTVGYVNSRTNTRAWARWNGTNGVITSSYNVSSVTRNSTGDYTVAYTTALADANYAILTSGAGDTVYGGYGMYVQLKAAPTTTGCGIITRNNGGTYADQPSVQIAVFGN
jgi:hypothetical protein